MHVRSSCMCKGFGVFPSGLGALGMDAREPDLSESPIFWIGERPGAFCGRFLDASPCLRFPFFARFAKI